MLFDGLSRCGTETHVQGSGLAGKHVDSGDEGLEALFSQLELITSRGKVYAQTLPSFREIPQLTVDPDIGLARLRAQHELAVFG
jgi:hypothetical protein